MIFAIALAALSQTTDRPMVLPPEQMKEIYALYQRPDVRSLRREFHRFAKGDTKHMNPIALNGILDGGTNGLTHFEQAYFASPFMVVEIAPFFGGGTIISVVFVDKPDRMFDCWVFPLRGERFELRTISQDVSFTAKEIQVVYRNLLADRRNRL